MISFGGIFKYIEQDTWSDREYDTKEYLDTEHEEQMFIEKFMFLNILQWKVTLLYIYGFHSGKNIFDLKIAQGV